MGGLAKLGLQLVMSSAGQLLAKSLAVDMHVH